MPTTPPTANLSANTQAILRAACAAADADGIIPLDFWLAGGDVAQKAALVRRGLVVVDQPGVGPFRLSLTREHRAALAAAAGDHRVKTA